MLSEIDQTYAVASSLGDAPAQKLLRLGTGKAFPTWRDKVGLTRTHVSINGIQQEVVFDTGANLSVITQSAAKKLGLKVPEGVYVATHGPSYETPAEIKMYEKLGGDVVGMSTVPEAIALRHMGRRVAAISCVTNLAAGVSETLLSHEEVLENAREVHSALSKLIVEVLRGEDHG